MLHISPSFIGPRLFFIWFYDKSITLNVLFILRPWESCFSSGSLSLQFDNFKISKDPAEWVFARNLPIFESPCKLFPLKFNEIRDPYLEEISYYVSFSNILSIEICVKPHCFRLIFYKWLISLIESAKPLTRSSLRLQYERFSALKAFMLEKHCPKALAIFVWCTLAWINVQDFILSIWT